MRGCDYSYRIAQMGAASTFYANIGKDSASHGIYVGTAVTTASVTNNAIARAGGDAYRSSTAGAAIKFTNNIAIASAGCGVNLAAGNVETHNDAYGNGTNFCAGGSSTSPGTGSFSLDPKFLGGPNPTTAEGFKPFATSPLCGAGYPTATKYDYANKRLGNPPT